MTTTTIRSANKSLPVHHNATGGDWEVDPQSFFRWENSLGVPRCLRANEALAVCLGRAYLHDVDLSVITKPRMIEVSIETTHDPPGLAIKHLIQDAIDDNDREAIRSASGLEQAGSPV